MADPSRAAPRAVRPTISSSADIDRHRDPSAATPAVVPRTSYYPTGEPILRPPPGDDEVPRHSENSPSRRHSAASSRTSAGAVSRDESVRASTTFPSGARVSDHAGTASTQPRPSLSSSIHHRAPKAAGADAGGLQAEAGLDEAPIPEDALLRDVVYIMLGSEATQYARWSSDGCYTLSAGSLRQRNLFSRLQETGVLRRKITRLLATRSPSFLQQSLKKAVERQLEHHDLFIATLRERSVAQLADIEIAHRRALPKLHALYVILRDSEAAKGGELVTKLQSLYHHGGRDMVAFLGDVYREAVRPLLHMTVHWITKGEIMDPYFEFFISENHRVKETESTYWQTRFAFRQDMLPATLTVQQAKDILTVGKNIDFIRRCLHAKDWKMDPSIVAAAKAASFDDATALGQVIRSALDHTNAAVLSLLFEKNSFNEILLATRSLLLVSTGDLYDAIVEALQDTLSAPVLQINTTIVRDQLQSAAHRIAVYLTPAERDALDYVEVLFEEDVNRMALGHDSFSITLPFIRPHNAVLHDEALIEYRRLFRFLFKVKRAEVLLKRAWRQAIFMSRSPHTRLQSASMRQARQCGVMMYKHFSGFVTNVQMYLMTEAVHGSWAQLQTSLNNSKSLDDVIDSHDRYLAALVKFTLLDSQYARASDEIHVMLDQVFAFCELQRHLGQAVAMANEALLPGLVDRFRRLFDDFHTSMTRLLTLLEEDTLHFDFLQPLGARLNFNGFYHVDPDSVRAEF